MTTLTAIFHFIKNPDEWEVECGPEYGSTYLAFNKKLFLSFTLSEVVDEIGIFAVLKSDADLTRWGVRGQGKIAANLSLFERALLKIAFSKKKKHEQRKILLEAKNRLDSEGRKLKGHIVAIQRPRTEAQLTFEMVTELHDKYIKKATTVNGIAIDPVDGRGLFSHPKIGQFPSRYAEKVLEAAYEQGEISVEEFRKSLTLVKA